jgi:hypothetical protein
MFSKLLTLKYFNIKLQPNECQIKIFSFPKYGIAFSNIIFQYLYSANHLFGIGIFITSKLTHKSSFKLSFHQKTFSSYGLNSS